MHEKSSLNKSLSLSAVQYLRQTLSLSLQTPMLTLLPDKKTQPALICPGELWDT